MSRVQSVPSERQSTGVAEILDQGKGVPSTGVQVRGEVLGNAISGGERLRWGMGVSFPSGYPLKLMEV